VTFLLLFVLLILSAFFSGSETAFFSLDRMDKIALREGKSAAAQLVLTLLERPRDLLVAILFGNVLVNVLYFSVASSIAHELRGSYPLLEPVAHMSALFAIIIAGEVMPKTLTIGSPALVARLVAPFLSLWQRLSRFLTEPLSLLTGKSLRLLDRRWPTPGPLSDIELAELVNLQSKGGILTRSLGHLLEDVLLLSRVRVREIMTPRVDIICFDVSTGRDSFMAFISKVKRSKILVHKGEGLDGVYGVLNVKTVMRSPNTTLETHVDPAWFIPDTKGVESLLQEMLSRDASLAVVVDEYGGTAGLVTMEDVIEEVVGDISKHTSEPSIQLSGPSQYSVSGVVSVRELNEILKLSLSEEGATTVAGFVARSLGHIPQEGDRVEFVDGVLTVVSVDKFRTRQVLIEITGIQEISGDAL
jgi:putative hemolysin